jgi:hypothetical protein
VKSAGWAAVNNEAATKSGVAQSAAQKFKKVPVGESTQVAQRKHRIRWFGLA